VRNDDRKKSSSRQRDQSNESLERIHTFSLKNSFTTERPRSELSVRSSSKHREEGNLEKTYYVEESIKPIEAIISQADPILSELASQAK